MTTTIHHRVDRADLALGVVCVAGVRVGAAPSDLAEALDALVARRASQELDPREEALRLGSRDMLRNGKYKPTGRGKPASEYLLRVARQGAFPRINGPVDANNLVSLEACVPISLWDLDLAGARELEVRLGREGEHHVFNLSGQELALRDLVCGCALAAGGSQPCITPVKDSMATKVRPETRRVGGIIYYPLARGSLEHLGVVTGALMGWLERCGARTRSAAAVVAAGGSAVLDV